MSTWDEIIKCDYKHEPGEPSDIAEWVFVGESGEYFACGYHFEMRTEEGKRHWHKLTYEVR